MALAPSSAVYSDRTGQPASRSQPVLVAAGTTFEGLLGSRDGVRVEGKFEGEIAAGGRVELGQQSQVKGIVEADEIVVAGLFEGSLVARRRIELLATARVLADLTTSELVAEDGCMVQGSCHAGSRPK